jgi:8-oxo-dGTP pyrophosphatase MutT (NUDIX family)
MDKNMDIPSNSDPHVEHELRANPRRTVAVVFVVGKDRRLLLVRTKRLPNQWQPIGGGARPDDSTVRSTALREVEEEAGLHLGEKDLRDLYSTPYDFGEGTVYFFITSLPAGSQLTFDEGEIEEWRWVSLDDALSLPVFPATERCLTYMTSRPELLGQC